MSSRRSGYSTNGGRPVSAGRHATMTAVYGKPSPGSGSGGYNSGYDSGSHSSTSLLREHTTRAYTNVRVRPQSAPLHPPGPAPAVSIAQRPQYYNNDATTSSVNVSSSSSYRAYREPSPGRGGNVTIDSPSNASATSSSAIHDHDTPSSASGLGSSAQMYSTEERLTTLAIYCLSLRERGRFEELLDTRLQLVALAKLAHGRGDAEVVSAQALLAEAYHLCGMHQQAIYHAAQALPRAEAYGSVDISLCCLLTLGR
jgi:hypothetical protein